MEAQRSSYDPVTRKDRMVSESPLLAIAPGPTTILRSSLTLTWRGLVLERHLSAPGQRVSASTDRHIISMVKGAPSHFDHRNLSGKFVSCLARPGTIMITPAGPAPDMRLHSRSEFVHCAIENSCIVGVMQELERPPARQVFRPALQNKPIQRIMELLLDELEAPCPSDRLYVEALAHALVARYLRLNSVSSGGPNARTPCLLPRILKRVRDKIEANLEADLSLDSLAEESGYSRAHFLRMFRAATGLTPHQYVIDLRLRRAQERLRHTGSSIIDVAVSCGFSSQSHMTSVFRERLEMTPGEFRRSA